MQFFEPWEATVETWAKNFLPGDVETSNRRYVEIAEELLRISNSSSNSSCSSEHTNNSMVSHSTIADYGNFVSNVGRAIGSEIMMRNQLYNHDDANNYRFHRGGTTPLINKDTFEDDVERAVAREIFLSKPPPPAGYICDICGMEGHFKNMCSKIPNKVDGFTPYQGAKQCFGEFICSKCKRKWMSYHSWANFAQKCVKCKINVFPKKQRPLIPPNENFYKHPQHLCQKCNVIGDNCGTSCKSKFNNGNKNKTPNRGRKHGSVNAAQCGGSYE